MIVHNKQNHLNHSKFDKKTYNEARKRQQAQNKTHKQRRMSDKLRDMEQEYRRTRSRY